MLRRYPAGPYVPGPGSEPDHAWLETIKRDYDDAALVEKGFDLLRAGYFWEAHELLEKAWLARTPNSPEREMLRAIIQIANALLKQAMGKQQAAARLLADSREILGQLKPGQLVLCFDPATLSENIVAACQELPAGDGPNIRKLRHLESCKKMQDI